MARASSIPAPARKPCSTRSSRWASGSRSSFCVPPTLKALTQRVRDPHLPPVHVVHFDGHGVYRPDTGLGYLLFENDEHQAQLVNADDLGTLLNDTGVPLMIARRLPDRADAIRPIPLAASRPS